MSASDSTDPSALLVELIRCPSVTPAEAGALALLETALAGLGFAVERPAFGEGGTTSTCPAKTKQGRASPSLA